MRRDWQMQKLLWIPASVLQADPTSSSRRGGKTRGRGQLEVQERNLLRSAGGISMHD